MWRNESLFSYKYTHRPCPFFSVSFCLDFCFLSIFGLFVVFFFLRKKKDNKTRIQYFGQRGAPTVLVYRNQGEKEKRKKVIKPFRHSSSSRPPPLHRRGWREKILFVKLKFSILSRTLLSPPFTRTYINVNRVRAYSDIDAPWSHLPSVVAF